MNNGNWRSNPGANSTQLFTAFDNPGTRETDIQTSYEFDEDSAIVTVKYTFEAPESNIGTESRSLELSPNFQSCCTPYEALNS